MQACVALHQIKKEFLTSHNLSWILNHIYQPRQRWNSPLRRQFVQPAHFEHLPFGGSVEACIWRNIGQCIPAHAPQGLCRLWVEVTLHHDQGSILRAGGSWADSKSFRGRGETLVRDGSWQNADTLVHCRVLVFVGFWEGWDRWGIFILRLFLFW